MSAEDELKTLRRAVRRYFRAKYDDSYSPDHNWHKRHDEGRAEAALMELLKPSKAAARSGGEQPDDAR